MSALPLELRFAAIALALASALGLFAWAAHHEREIGRAEVHQQWDKQTAVLMARAASAGEANREIERQRTQTQQEVAHVADLSRARADADRRTDVDLNKRLQQRFTTLAAACDRAPGNPGVAGPGPAASSAGDLLAYMQSRLDEAQGRIADFADAASIAGAACERSYDALKR